VAPSGPGPVEECDLIVVRCDDGKTREVYPGNFEPETIAWTRSSVPVEGPLQVVELDGTLEQLQALVGGFIEAVPLPSFIAGADHATA
jgi:hypothetical protein